MFGACYPSSVFDWSPAVRAFGHAPWTSNVPIGRTSQQPQPQPQPSGLTGFVGGNPFGMNQTNYASSQPAVSAIASPSFGHTIDPGFLCTSSSFFGSTTTPPAPAPPSTTTAVPGSITNAPAFGIPTTTGAFGSPTTPAFGIPASHSSTMAASGSTTAFGTPITTCFFGSTITPTFSDPRSTHAFASHTIGACSSTLPPPLCANCSMPNATSSGSGESFGDSATFVRQFSSTNASLTSRMPVASISPTSSTTSFNFPPTLALGGSTFGNPIPPPPPFSEKQVAIRPSLPTGSIGQCKGTRVAPYTQTSEMVDSLSSTGMSGRVHSISAIPFYKSKSHEELRWEDYERGDKGGLLPSYNVFAQHKDRIDPACSSNISNPFTTNTSAFGTSTTPGFSDPFTPNTSSTPSPLFSSRSTPFILGASTASPTFPGRSIFEASVPSSPTFPTGSSSSLQWPCTHSLGGQTGNPAIGEISSGLSSNLSYNQPNMSNMNPAYAGFPPSLPSSIPPTKPLPFGHTMPSQSSFQASQPSQATNSGSFNNLHPTQSDGGSVYPGASSTGGHNNLGLVLPWGLFFYPLPPYLTQVVPYQPQHPGAAYFASPHSYLEPRPFCQATPPPFGASIGLPCANWNAPSFSVAPSPAFQQATISPFGPGTHPFAPSFGVAQASSAFEQSTTSPFGTATHPFSPSAGSAFQRSTTSPVGPGTHPFAPSFGVAQASSAFEQSTTSPFGTATHPFAPSAGSAFQRSTTSPFGPGTHPFAPSFGGAQASSAFEQSTTSPFGTATHPFAPLAGSAFQRSTTSLFGRSC